MKKILVLTALAVATASAFTYDGTNGMFGAPGSTRALGVEEVPAAKVGRRCAVTIETTNNTSVRPGSDITVSSGLERRTFTDVEAEVGSRSQTVTMVLGDTVAATLTFGPEGAFSGSGEVTVGECEPPTIPVVQEFPTPPPAPLVPPTPVVTPPRVTG